MSDAGFAAEDEIDPSADDADLSVEERARIRGWKPLEEYHGDPQRWRSAEDFLRIGDGDNRILREENQRLTSRVHRLEQTMQKTSAEQMAAITELRALARRADEQGYKRARDELLEERRVAVESGDTGAFDQIEQRIGALDKERRETAPPPAPAPAPAPEPAAKDPDITAFQLQNRNWFVPGTDLHRAMCAHFEIVENQNPALPMAQKLETAKLRTIKDFPARFPNEMPDREPAGEGEYDDDPQPRRRAASVATPAPAPRRGPRQPTGWDAIEDPQDRADARAAFESIKRAEPGMTETEYLEIYTNPHADELALRAQRKKA